MTFELTLDESKVVRNWTHYAAMFVWVGWTFFYAIFIPFAIFLYLYAKPLLSILIGLIVLSGLCTTKREYQPKWGFAIGDWINTQAAKYFHLQFYAEDKEALKTSGKAIIALEPHDVLPLSIFAFNDVLNTVPGHKCLGCITSVCFSIPLMKHIYTWVNAVSVDKKNICRLIEKGISPIICPGGVQEVTLLRNKDEVVLYLNKRLGFVKLAMKYGIPIIPAFTFGLRKTFSFWVPEGKFFESVGRSIGFLPMIFFGLWGLPLGPPKPCDYVVIIGKPIPIPAIENPSEEEIRKYHVIYVQELTRIFELEKAKHGYSNLQLRIV